MKIASTIALEVTLRRLSVLISLVLLVLFLPGECLAYDGPHSDQNDFVITLAGDTLYGKIERQSAFQGQVKCIFLAEGAGFQAEYAPAGLRGYVISGEKYYETKAIKQNNITTQIFLECILKGPVSFYAYLGKEGGHIQYFAQKDSEDLYLLTVESTTVQQVDKYGQESHAKSKSTVERFKGVLAWLMSDCSGVGNDINSLRLSSKDLIKIGQKYAQCTQRTPSFVSQNKSRKSDIRFGLYAGLSLSTMSFESTAEAHNYLTKSDIGYSIFPVFGISMDISLPVISQRLGLNIELFYLRNKFSFTHTRQVNDFEFNYNS